MSLMDPIFLRCWRNSFGGHRPLKSLIRHHMDAALGRFLENVRR